jgi:hypothetical protein
MSVRRSFVISNTTQRRVDVAVYPAAARLRRGSFEFAPGRTRNALSSWISLNRADVRLLPGAQGVVALAIKAPKAASSGEHYAVVWAEVSSPAPPGGGVTLVSRVGIRVYISIAPGGGLRANFGIGPLTAQRSSAGQPLVVGRVLNTGRRTLEISGHLTLSKGPGGLRAGPIPVKLAAALAPGATQQATVRLDNRLPRGPWRVRLVLGSGSIERHAQATLTFPPIATAAESHRLNQLLIALLLLLGLVAAALLFSRRRRPGSPQLTLPAVVRLEGRGD